MIPWNKGKKLSAKHRKNLSLSHIGIQAKEKHPMWKGGKPECSDCGKKLSVRKLPTGFCFNCFVKNCRLGERHFAWKKEPGYRALHYWVASRLGKAIQCEHCGIEKTTPKSIHWANKSHEYKRELTDWIQLCVPCHKKYDKSQVELVYSH